VSIKANDCEFNGCGNPFNTNADYRRAINIKGDTTKSQLLVSDCKFRRVDDSGNQFGGPVSAICRKLRFTDNLFEDSDANDLQKFFRITADEVVFTDNEIITSELNSYANSRIVSITQSTQPSILTMAGNTFYNKNVSAVDNFIHSDFTINDMDFANNHFRGPANSQISSNIAGERNKLFPQVGFGAVTRPGGGPPGAGAWARGDIIWDSAPSAGGTIGWVCVASGNPGTWRAFGNISA
jgi:hypothetical protein